MQSSADKRNYTIANKRVSLVKYRSASELTRQLIFIFENSDVIFLHSIFFPLLTKIQLIHRGMNCYLKKLVWIEWGFDLYYQDTSSLVQRIKSKIKSFTVTHFEKKIPYFVAIHPADIQSYHTIIGGSAKIFLARYSTAVKPLSNIINDNNKIPISQKIRENKPIVIQVGHRADHILNHRDTLIKLSRFADKNIKIFLPLCYGDKPYAKKITELAHQLFGEKAICQLEVMPCDDYIRQLKSIDIFILNSKRQIALGNLHPMMLMQKKIVLPSDSVLYNYYLKTYTPIFPYESISECSFDELVKDVDMRLARKNLIEYISSNSVELWNNIFREITSAI
jgi:hypothetical protein